MHDMFSNMEINTCGMLNDVEHRMNERESHLVSEIESRTLRQQEAMQAHQESLQAQVTREREVMQAQAARQQEEMQKLLQIQVTSQREEMRSLMQTQIIQQYDYEIEHRPGRLHSNADALSRETCKQCWGKVAGLMSVRERRRLHTHSQ